jgi:hypothetical protein
VKCSEVAEHDKRFWKPCRVLFAQLGRVLSLFERLIRIHEAGEDGDEVSTMSLSASYRVRLKTMS